MSEVMMDYRCSYDDCSNEGIVRVIIEDAGPLSPDDPRRRCEGTVLVEQTIGGELTHEQAQCFRPLDRLPNGPDGVPEHVETARPTPDPPTYDESLTWPTLWAEIERVREQQLLASDWTQNPPGDCPQTVLDQISANAQGWVSWRQAVRDLPMTTDQAPEFLWPWPPPPAPFCAIPEPPAFVGRTPPKVSNAVTQTSGKVVQDGSTVVLQNLGSVAFAIPATPLSAWTEVTLTYTPLQGTTQNAWLAIQLDAGTTVYAWLGDPPSYDQTADGLQRTLDLMTDEPGRIDGSPLGASDPLDWAGLVALAGDKVPVQVYVEARGNGQDDSSQAVRVAGLVIA